MTTSTLSKAVTLISTTNADPSLPCTTSIEGRVENNKFGKASLTVDLGDKRGKAVKLEKLELADLTLIAATITEFIAAVEGVIV